MTEGVKNRPHVHAVPSEKGFGVLCILVQGNGGFNIQIAIQQIEDMAVVAVFLDEFGGNEPEFVVFGNLTVELAQSTDGKVTRNYVQGPFLRGCGAKPGALVDEIPNCFDVGRDVLIATLLIVY